MSDAATALAEVLRNALLPDFRLTEPITERLAAAVVAAVRGLSPDLQAELIGGAVEVALRNGRAIRFTTGPMPGSPGSRAVGPWVPEETS